MRKILFRGYDAVGDKGWVYGDFTHGLKILADRDVQRVMVGGYEVYPESVGQFTGILDMNGKGVYEGDVVRCDTQTKQFTGVVKWDAVNPCFCIKVEGETLPEYDFIKCNLMMIEIIGNTFKPNKQ